LVRPMDLERFAGHSVSGKNVAVRARIDFANALLASEIPNAWDCVTVLALTESGATTTVAEVDKGIDALVVTTDKAGNGASRESFRTRGNGTRPELALPVGKAFMSIRLVVITISGFIRWSGWVGWVRMSRGRVAAERVAGPIPVIIALRGRGVIGWLVRSTTAQSVVPRPAVGAAFAGGWTGRITGSSVRKTAVFGLPPELTFPTVSVAAGEDEGKSQSQEKDASNERHF